MSRLLAFAEVRDKNGSTMREVANHCGVTRDGVYKTLRKSGTTTSNPTLNKLCEFFEITVADFDKLAVKLSEGDQHE